MTDTEWSLEEEPAPKKKGFPKWLLLGCGGGCLLLLLVCGGLAFMGARVAKEAADPEQQWPRLAKVLPFEERPENIQLQVGLPSVFGLKFFQLADNENGLYLTLMLLPVDEAAELDPMFDGEDVPNSFNIGIPADGQPGEVELQGQLCRCVRFSEVVGGQFFEPDNLGPGMWVDVSEGEGDVRLAQFRRIASEDGITDEEIQAFFEPFDLWRQR